ncbi:MAG: hypothetical protein KF809_00115 [Chloroflexi bacterium]|nr:hypothetical protein [Chloroflexota bacterium]
MSALAVGPGATVRIPIARSEVTLHCRFEAGTWTVEATAGRWYVRLRPSWYIRGECARSDILGGIYLAIHLDGWTSAEPPAPIIHVEWHTLGELVARYEGVPL